MKSTTLRFVVAALLLAGAQVHAQSMQKGAGGSEVQGSAGPSGAQNSNGLQQCAKPMGALAVVEPQDEVLQSLARFNLQSPSGLIRLMVQQSNCFIVVERGVAMKNMQQERALAEAGELRKGSNIGGGQMVGADFVLTPSIVFSEGNAGGIGGAVAGLFKDKSPALGALAGGLKFKEAQTSMLSRTHAPACRSRRPKAAPARPTCAWARSWQPPTRASPVPPRSVAIRTPMRAR